MNALFHASWLPALGWTLLHSLWEGALVPLTVALCLWGLRGASPRLRYAVAVAGLLLVAILPLRHLLPPRPEAAPVLHLEARSEPWPSVSNTMPSPPPALRTRMVGKLERSMPWLVLLWSFGAFLGLLRLAGGWAWLQRLRWQKAELAPDVLQRSLLDLCRRAGLKRAVTLLMCEDLAGPSVVGILRPAILVPAGWFLNLPPDHVEALLAHELAHVLRHDYAVNLLQSMLEVVLFYHPGVWWLSRRIRAERELACDTFAVSLMGDAFPLAEALTDLERRGLGRASFEPAPAAHGGSLMERISHLLLPPRRTSSAPAFGAMAIMGILLASGLRLAAQTPTPHTGNPSAHAKTSLTPDVPPIIPKGIILPSGMKVGNDRAAIYIHSTNAKDSTGKNVPFTQLLDIKADQVPLTQIWRSFEEVTNNRKEDMGRDLWDSRREEMAGPRINLDLDAVTPAEARALLNHLADQYGVPQHQEALSSGPHHVHVALTKVSSNPQAIQCSAEMTDLTDGKLVFAPRILVNKGEVGRASIGDGELSVVFEIAIDKAGTSGTYTMTFSKGKVVVSTQMGKVPI